MAKKKRTPTKRAILLKWLSDGSTIKAACGAARIGQSTFFDWLKSDPEFSKAVDAAEAEAERRWMLKTSKEPTGTRWLLSRRFRKDWSDRLEIEHTGGVTIEYINNWRGPAADAAPGPADNPPAGPAVQLAGSGAPVAQDDDVHGNSGGRSPQGEIDPLGRSDV